MNFPSWELIFYVTPTLHECTMRFGHTVQKYRFVCCDLNGFVLGQYGEYYNAFILHLQCSLADGEFFDYHSI